jgi:hypothetical protein
MKRIIILLCLLLATTANADVSGRLDSLRTYLYEKLRIPSTGTDLIDSVTANRALNQAIQRVCHDFPAIEKFDTVAIDSAVEGGDLNTDFLRIKSVHLLSGDSLRYGLEPISPVDLPSFRPTIGEAVQDKGDPLDPRYYYTFNNMLMVFPKWFRGDTAQYLVFYYALDSNMSADASVTQALPEYRPYILYDAAAKLSEVRGNYQEAMYWRGRYSEALQRPKARIEEGKQ